MKKVKLLLLLLLLSPLLAQEAMLTLPAGVKPIMEVVPNRPKVGQPVAIKFRVEADGAPLVDYDVVHEKKMHLIVVNQDYEDFQHVHPELDARGTFHLEDLVLNRPGRYYVYMDATPEGSQQVLYRFNLEVEGQSQPARLSTDLTPKRVGDVQIALTTAPQALKVGDAMLHFQLSREGKPVTDLVPFMGAMGHVVALGTGGKPFLHVHPLDGHDMGAHAGHDMGEHAGHQGMDMSSMPEAKPGEVVFHASFPSPGFYKIWGQFQRGEEMLIAPFVVQVQ
jgi:hypothetical protein